MCFGGTGNLASELLGKLLGTYFALSPRLRILHFTGILQYWPYRYFPECGIVVFPHMILGSIALGLISILSPFYFYREKILVWYHYVFNTFF